MDIKLQVGVKIFLKNKDNKYLLLKRPAGMWDIPGGRINSGVGLMENLKREIKEETQLDFDGNAQLMGAQDMMFAERHVVRLSYTGNIEGNPVISNEHTDYKWVTPDEMKTFNDLDPYVLELIKKNGFI